jgi:hypothetical protein
MQVIESEAGRLRITTQMSGRSRLYLCAAAMLLLAVPYVLIVWPPVWATGLVYWSLAGIATAGVLPSATVLVSTALLSSRREVEFDRERGAARFVVWRPLLGAREHLIPFEEIVRVDAIDHDNLDLNSSYDIRLTPSNGPKIEFGEFYDSEQLAAAICKICWILGE